MANAVVLGILAIAAGGAVLYMIKARKKGGACIGCSCGGCCSGKDKANSGCGCGCHSAGKE